MKFLNTPSKLVLLFCFFIAQWHIQSVKIPCDNWKTIIQSDAYGYYGYLPAVFIYRSFDYKIEQNPASKEPVKKENPGGAIMYYVGESVLLLPFFTIADMITQTFDLSLRNGYTFYYQLFVSIAALFYLFLGLVMVRKLLLDLGFSEQVTSITLVCIFLGTQLYYYALHEPGMSHVYSFSMIATLLNLYQRQLLEPKNSRWLLISLVIALIIFLRPINVVFAFAFLPLAKSLSKSKEFITAFFKSGLLIIVSSILILGLFFFLQAYMYHLQTGNWWIYSYGEDGFNWTTPQIGNVLFSYRKGLFIYTPLLLLALAGVWFMRKKLSNLSLLSWFAIMLLYLYITASWWYWAYGGSFGMRPFIDTYALWAIPFAALCEYALKSKIKAALLYLSATLIIYLSLVQSYQYIVKILPYEYITKKKYWHLFLKTADIYRFSFPNVPDSTYYFKKSPSFIDTLFLKNREVEISYENKISEDTKYEFIADKLKTIGSEKNFVQSIIIDCELWLNSLNTNATINCSLVSDFSKEADFWFAKPMVTLVDKKQEWVNAKLMIQLPENIDQDLFCSVYLYNGSNVKIKARNLRVRFYNE